MWVNFICHVYHETMCLNFTCFTCSGTVWVNFTCRMCPGTVSKLHLLYVLWDCVGKFHLLYVPWAYVGTYISAHTCCIYPACAPWDAAGQPGRPTGLGSRRHGKWAPFSTNPAGEARRPGYVGVGSQTNLGPDNHTVRSATLTTIILSNFRRIVADLSDYVRWWLPLGRETSGNRYRNLEIFLQGF